MSINRKIALMFTLLFTCSAVFLICEVLYVKHEMVIEIGAAFVTAVFVLFVFLIFILKRHMLDIMNQLSELIASIIDMRENEVFSVLNDDMLSKLQSQVMKLSGILRMQNLKLQKEKNEIKSLISDISHQLKNPLANLNIYTSLLLDEELDNVRRLEYTKNINSQVEKLSWLMESMIKMSRLESGIIQLNQEITGLNDVILTSIKQIFQKAEKKNIKVDFIHEDDIKLSIDKKWTAEAIANILDNAVKYSLNNGAIIISICKYELFVRIDIADTGIGLEEAEISNIFKRFYRGKNAANEEGVGIGLYLSREIITMQKGYIKVKSTAGRGSVFSVFLPYE